MRLVVRYSPYYPPDRCWMWEVTGGYRERWTGWRPTYPEALELGIEDLLYNQERKAMASKVQDPEPLRAKWIMDKATTLAEAAAKLRAEADRLDQLAKDGWTLEGPIDDDWGFLVPPEGRA